MIAYCNTFARLCDKTSSCRLQKGWGRMGLTADPLLLVIGGLVTAAATELLSWLLVYRTPNYRRMKEELDRSSKKLEAIKQSSSTAAATKPNRSNKKEKRLEENMKTTTKDMTATRFKLGIIMSVSMFLVYQLISAKWDGIVVAKLPFSPPGFLQAITHRGLIGDDPTDCAAAFIFAMSFAYFKQNTTKVAGFSPSRAAARVMAPSTAVNPDKYK